MVDTWSRNGLDERTDGLVQDQIPRYLDSQQEEPERDSDLRKLLAATLRWVGARQYEPLSPSPGRRDSQAVSNGQRQSVNIEDVVAERVEARLPDLIREEILRILRDSLDGVEQARHDLPITASDLSWLQGGDHATGERTGRQRTFGDGLDAQVPEVVDEALYEGTVKITLQPNPGIGSVVRFLHELELEQEMHVLKVASNQDRINITLSLRQPLNLEDVLPDMDTVSYVKALPVASPSTDPPVLRVQLNESKLFAGTRSNGFQQRLNADEPDGYPTQSVEQRRGLSNTTGYTQRRITYVDAENDLIRIGPHRRPADLIKALIEECGYSKPQAETHVNSFRTRHGLQ